MELLILEGDGIGPDIAKATISVLDVIGEQYDLDLSMTWKTIGLASLARSGTTFPLDVLQAAREADGTILGPVSHNDYPPVAEGGVNPSGALRKGLDLYANIRPSKTRKGFPPPCGKPLDLVIVRENTEGFYSDRSMHLGPGEFMPTPDLAMSLRKVSREGSTRIAEAAFKLAMTRPRQKVTSVHKANVLRVSDGLFLECVREVAGRYPNVAYEERIVDAMAAYLVRDASVFDVIVTTNMFGDILSDEASELSGSLGLAGSLNASDTHAIAQAQHGSAPDIAGQGIANPTSLIASAAMLLSWLGEKRADRRLFRAAEEIEMALDLTIANPSTRTRDLGGTISLTPAEPRSGLLPAT